MQLADRLRSRRAITKRKAEPSNVSSQLLRSVIADLDSLNRETEKIFLCVGSRLARFMESVRGISSELTVMACSANGQRTCEALKAVLQHSQATEPTLVSYSGGLSGMRGRVGLLRRTLSELQGTVSTFHTLGLLTRIETARLGSTGADFSGLANDVDSLAKQVQTRVENAMAITHSLVLPIDEAIRQIANLRAGEAKELPALVSGALEGISAFQDAQLKANESSIRLRTQYEAIAESFNKLIVSLQFHDITRQQVEHVMEVLGRLTSEPQASDTGSTKPLRGISAVLELQSAQLADAAQKFTASVESVTRNLEGITKHVLEMAKESRALSGLSEDGKGSFYLPMERECGMVLTGLDHIAEAEAANLATRKSLAESIEQMREPIREIQNLEIEIRRMALNARISACQLGPTGSALDVLAGSVQQLATDCGERSELLAESLKSMSAATDRSIEEYESNSRTEHGEEVRDQEVGFVEELRISLTDLHAVTKRNFATIDEIAARGSHLAGEIAATSESISVGKLFAETVVRARGSLKEIGERVQQAFPFDRNNDMAQQLTELVSQYTMQAERDVHQGIFGAVKTTSSMPIESHQSPFREADDVGDNVEFF